MAFPCNQFHHQEPGTEAEVKAFVLSKYKVRFPLFEKILVNGEHPHPVYAFLRTHSELYDHKHGKAQEIPWNYSKFIVNRQGQVIKFAKPEVNPAELRHIIENELRY